MQAGELLEVDEVELAPGESYTTPECLLCFSYDGMTGLAQQWHSYVRKTYETSASDQVRPVQLNTWEACYFGVNETTVIELIDEAADLGIERFVLDDGWFRNRHNDRTSLGDWQVDEQKFPSGLAPIVALSRERPRVRSVDRTRNGQP